jgi:hypothetical protein
MQTERLFGKESIIPPRIAWQDAEKTESIDGRWQQARPGREQFVRFVEFVARSAIASSLPCREISNSTNATNLTNHIHRAGGTLFDVFSNVLARAPEPRPEQSPVPPVVRFQSGGPEHHWNGTSISMPSLPTEVFANTPRASRSSSIASLE